MDMYICVDVQRWHLRQAVYDIVTNPEVIALRNKGAHGIGGSE